MSIDIKMYEIKLRHGFEFYFQRLYGYYPSWDAHENEYLVKVTQEKWSHWSAFFRVRSKEMLESIPHYQMADLYLRAEGCK
jgi:hypothetical protein